MNKYHAKKTIVDNITFDSKKEAGRYGELRILERAGEITDLVCQPVYVLQEGFIYRGRKIQPITYRADFSYSEKHTVFLDKWIDVVEDVKGVQTQLFKVKAKMFKRIYPEIEFRIVED